MKRWSSLAMALLFSALPVMATVTGTVVRPDGTPVANARVAALRPVAATDGVSTLQAEPEKPLATAVTETKGAFAVDVEGRGLVRLHVGGDGFAALGVIAPLGA